MADYDVCTFVKHHSGTTSHYPNTSSSWRSTVEKRIQVERDNRNNQELYKDANDIWCPFCFKDPVRDVTRSPDTGCHVQLKLEKDGEEETFPAIIIGCKSCNKTAGAGEQEDSFRQDATLYRECWALRLSWVDTFEEEGKIHEKRLFTGKLFTDGEKKGFYCTKVTAVTKFPPVDDEDEKVSIQGTRKRSTQTHERPIKWRNSSGFIDDLLKDAHPDMPRFRYEPNEVRLLVSDDVVKGPLSGIPLVRVSKSDKCPHGNEYPNCKVECCPYNEARAAMTPQKQKEAKQQLKFKMTELDKLSLQLKELQVTVDKLVKTLGGEETPTEEIPTETAEETPTE